MNEGVVAMADTIDGLRAIFEALMDAGEFDLASGLALEINDRTEMRDLILDYIEGTGDTKVRIAR